MNSHSRIDIAPAAIGFAGMMADPAADGWERAGLFDQCQGFCKFSLGRQIHVSLNVNVGRTTHFAGRCLLFFSTGFARHGIAAGALVFVVQHHSGFRILGNGIFGAGHGTGWIFTVVTKQRFEDGGFLENPDHPRAHSQPMFLLAGDFTRMAAAAIFLIEF